MEVGLRRVRKLWLRAKDESLNRRGAILIEDALRTASLPDGDSSRLLLVRSLPLGRIRASEPPSAIAMRIEARCRRLGFDAVHAASDTASSADAVFFNDDLEPNVVLALKIACGDPAPEWFWPLAIPTWSAALSREEQMRAILAGALASSAGAAAALVLIRQLIRAGAIAPMLSAIRHQDGPALMREYGWSMPQLPREPELVESREKLPPPAFAQVARPWFVEWGASDARSFWLACAMLSIERPALASHPELTERAIEFIEATLWLEVQASIDDKGGARPEFDATPDSEPGISDREPSPHAAQTAAEHERASSGAMKFDPWFDEPIEIPRDPRAFTMCGGLFFVVAVMERLGVARWLEMYPEAREFGLPAIVLRTIALDLDCSPDDPVLATLASAPDDSPEMIRAMARNWIRWIRRYLRRNVHIALTPLLRRPARIAFTDLNIDVMFRFDRADIRVRRAGLDIDPGWTPWLGRVIRFRYVGDEIYDA